MLRIFDGSAFLPAFLVVFSSCTFIINYIIAILRRDVDVVFPYISDVGVQPPESCIFSFMATISAFTVLATMFYRYKFVQHLSDKTSVITRCLNITALVCAVLSCLGMSIVASFQETTMETVHDIGAGVFFCFGLFYIILQTVITYRTHPHGSSRRMVYIRGAFAVVVSVTVPITIISAACVHPTYSTKIHWNKDDQDYIPHRLSTVSEWTSAFTFVFFFYTYIQEFTRFKMRVEVELVEQHPPPHT